VRRSSRRSAEPGPTRADGPRISSAPRRKCDVLHCIRGTCAIAAGCSSIARERHMPAYTKKDFSTDNVRRFLEPGPIILVSSAHKSERNIMTMGWHMIMGFSPSLVGCYIWSANHSHELVRQSKQCVINLPTEDLATTVVKIGNSSGRDVDKFAEFGLTAKPGSHVRAPLIAECYANFECELVDASLIRNYSLFVFEVVKAHVATAPKYPKTIHYRGDGEFMISGANTSRYRKLFRPEML
jgi:flavin reductase (DIM6/NTAB) family NADH-FMN oxidoreductase RutF